MAFYENDLIYILNAGDKYLTVDRSNLLLRELPIAPGSESNPGLCFQGDERSGIFLESEGKVAFTSLGWSSISFGNNELNLYDRAKNSVKLKGTSVGEKTIYFPNSNGTIVLREDSQLSKINNEATDIIYPGMVVKVDTATGVKKALSDVEANFGYGLALTQAAITVSLTVVYSGVFTLADWTNVTGTPTLTVGGRYYLSDTTEGTLTLTAPTLPQLVGVALSTTDLLLKI